MNKEKVAQLEAELAVLKRDRATAVRQRNEMWDLLHENSLMDERPSWTDTQVFPPASSTGPSE